MADLDLKTRAQKGPPMMNWLVVQCAHLEKWWSSSMGRMTSQIWNGSKKMFETTNQQFNIQSYFLRILGWCWLMFGSPTSEFTMEFTTWISGDTQLSPMPLLLGELRAANAGVTRVLADGTVTSLRPQGTGSKGCGPWRFDKWPMGQNHWKKPGYLSEHQSIVGVYGCLIHA